MADAPSLSPRLQRTRAALIDAGLDLLVDRPIDAIPIDDLVARAGVAKGSFFNHFSDKHVFAAAVAAKVRVELEVAVSAANDGISDPVERIARGMAVAASFAFEQPRLTVVLLRSQMPATSQTHPLNRGLRQDFHDALVNGCLRSEADDAGVLYWLGLCQVLMVHVIEMRPTAEQVAHRLSQMLVLGLTGIGVPEDQAARLADLARRGILLAGPHPTQPREGVWARPT